MPQLYYIYKIGTHGDPGRIYLHRDNEGHTQLIGWAMEFKSELLAHNHIGAYYPDSRKYGVWPVPADNTFGYYKAIPSSSLIVLFRREFATSKVFGFAFYFQIPTLFFDTISIEDIVEYETISRDEFDAKLAEVKAIVDKELNQ